MSEVTFGFENSSIRIFISFTTCMKQMFLLQAPEVLLDQVSVPGSPLWRLSGLQHRGRTSSSGPIPLPAHPQLLPRGRRRPHHLPLCKLRLADREIPAHHQQLAGQTVSTGVRFIYAVGNAERERPLEWIWVPPDRIKPQVLGSRCSSGGFGVPG